MCGIVGAVGQRDVTPILLEGLKRLEYRGYDSAGMAVLGIKSGSLLSLRTVGKVSSLAKALQHQPIEGHVGIAHTRWATHGRPSESNAHPHISNSLVAVVHNGIIENFEVLKAELVTCGYVVHSETDTEVIAHLIHRYYQDDQDLLKAFNKTLDRLEGAYALAIIHTDQPDRLIAFRRGSPLVVGLGVGEHFVASDPLALLPVSQRFIYLQERDLVDMQANQLTIYDADGVEVSRPVDELARHYDVAERGAYRHYMLKEIFEQPAAIYKTLQDRLSGDRVCLKDLGFEPTDLFQRVDCVHIVACGTSHHAAMVARYWLEGFVGIPCQTEIASEFRYREVAIPTNTLFIVLSQSGETADTLAALKKASQLPYLATLGISNTPGSLLARECDYMLMTKAGVEIGVASTKAFTTQLVVLMLLTLLLYEQKHGNGNSPKNKQYVNWVNALHQLPQYIERVLALDSSIKSLSAMLADKQHALFLGRGVQHPIAKEGALKLKETAYIHAEAYPAGELKHGPIALVDERVPVIGLVPQNNLLEKLKSTLNEVLARGGELIVFADTLTELTDLPSLRVLPMPNVPGSITPVVYVVALQLLAYYTAVFKGTDVDQPRNLAKAVTVE